MQKFRFCKQIGYYRSYSFIINALYVVREKVFAGCCSRLCFDFILSNELVKATTLSQLKKIVRMRHIELSSKIILEKKWVRGWKERLNTYAQKPTASNAVESVGTAEF